MHWNAQEIGYMGLVSAFNELHPEIASAGLHVSWIRIGSLNCSGCAPREKPEGLHSQYPTILTDFHVDVRFGVLYVYSECIVYNMSFLFACFMVPPSS